MANIQPKLGPVTPGAIAPPSGGYGNQQGGGVNPQTGLPWGGIPQGPLAQQIQPRGTATIDAMGRPLAPSGGAPVVPPTGLIGSEQALQGGLAAALAGLQQGIGQARGDISGSFGQARGDVSGMFGSGRRDVLGQVGQGTEGLNPFIAPGQQAQQRQAALSGALGADAQAQAMQSYMDSPGQSYLREQGEQAVLRNAAATGGLGGGRVLQELQRQGIGLAAQDFQNNFDRLGSVTDTGLTAAGQAGALYGQAGGQLASLAGTGMSQLGQFGSQQASLLGNLGLQGGLTAAELARGTGQDVASGRTQAGRDIAGQVGGTTSALADLVQQQGSGLSDLIGQGGTNLANLLSGYGADTAAGRSQLAQLLAQTRLSGTGQAAGLPGLPGVTATQGALSGIGDAASGIGTLMLASDRRLKENIRQIGVTPGGNNLYEWDWNDEGKRVAGGDPNVGVIAQEVPDAAFMGPDGYLRVDYSMVM